MYSVKAVAMNLALLRKCIRAFALSDLGRELTKRVEEEL
jgi:hypothetical protein